MFYAELAVIKLYKLFIIALRNVKKTSWLALDRVQTHACHSIPFNMYFCNLWPCDRESLIFQSQTRILVGYSKVITCTVWRLWRIRYASPCLWNKLPASFRQPNPDHSFSHSSQPNSLSSPVPSSPLSLSITPTLFRSKLKRYLFLKSFPP